MTAQRLARAAAICRVAPIFTRSLLWLAPLALASLAACGGGNGSSSAPNGSFSSSASSSSTTSGDGWVAGVYPPESQYQARCQNPRTGTDPSTGKPYADVQGTTTDENFWLRSWMNDVYLWYDEEADIDPGTDSSPTDYFGKLKTTQLDALGYPKDKFSFTLPTNVWQQESQSGVVVGYGLTWALLAASPPRQLYVALVWPGYPAEAAGLMRGSQILTIDGVDVANGSDVATLNAGLSPSAAGESHTFTYQNPGSATIQTVTMNAQNVTETPVFTVSTIPTQSGNVGYILFNSVIATSEKELIDAINQLKAANVQDLVLDLRYNGGGFLDIASELDYMIAGPGPTANAYFDKQTWNAKHPTTNPVTGTITPTPFYTGSSTGAALPYLSLPRVYVLTGTNTCSASEAIMNGLRGVNVQVIQIGSTTCGKPYGFYPQDNCGTTYFAIEFQGDNWANFGNYPDGLTPQNSSAASQLDARAVLPGCSVADDFNHALGGPSEGRLAAALAYRAGASCPAASGVTQPGINIQQRLEIRLAPWRTIRILRRPPRN